MSVRGEQSDNHFWVFSRSHRKQFFFGKTNPESPFQHQNKKPREKGPFKKR